MERSPRARQVIDFEAGVRNIATTHSALWQNAEFGPVHLHGEVTYYTRGVVAGEKYYTPSFRLTPQKHVLV